MLCGDENLIGKIIRKIFHEGAPAVHCEPLAGGLTNRNYKVSLGADTYVLRIGVSNAPVHGISRSDEYHCALTAYEAGISPEIIRFFPEEDVLVTRYIEGRPLTAKDIRHPRMISRIITLMKRYHSISNFPQIFCVCNSINSYVEQASSLGIDLSRDFKTPVEFLKSRCEYLAQPYNIQGACHNDLVPSNFIDDGERIWLIDWEYSRMGDVFFDMANLAGNCEFDITHEQMLLTTYFGSCDRNMLNRLHILRALSHLREGLWSLTHARMKKKGFDFEGYGRNQLECFQKFIQSTGLC